MHYSTYIKYVALVFMFIFMECFGSRLAYGQLPFKGKVIDKATRLGIPYSSLLLPQQKQGTYSDTTGRFSIALNRSLQPGDSLVVSHLGYQSLCLPLYEDQHQSPLTIELVSNALSLYEYVATPHRPTEYIKMAVEESPYNYDKNPHYIISYFENNTYENQQLIEGSESVFKTYYSKPNIISSEYQQEEHQILLYNSKHNVMPLNFMRKEIKKWGKGRKHDNHIEDFKDSTLRMTPLFVPIHSTAIPFLDSTYFKKFVYKQKEQCSRRGLIVIEFNTKQYFKYKHIKLKGNGQIYINCKDYAIAKIDLKLDVKLPFYIKTFLWVGFKKLSFKNIQISTSIEYIKKQKLWYPHSLYLIGKADATKLRWFTKNDKSQFEFSASEIVNQIITENVIPIAPKKKFSFYEMNLQNDIHIRWDDIIKVGRQIY